MLKCIRDRGRFVRCGAEKCFPEFKGGGCLDVAVLFSFLFLLNSCSKPDK